MANKNIIILLFLIILIVIIVSWVLVVGFWQKPSQPLKTSFPEQKAKPTQPFIPKEISHFKGIIKDVGDNYLIVKPQAMENEAIDYAKFMPSEVKVLITEKTSIFQVKNKDPKVFKKEMADYEKKIRGLSPEKAAFIKEPTPFELIPVKISQLQEGDFIAINAEGNIKGKKEITAYEIRFRR